MNILVMDAWLPTPDRDAASLRMFQLLGLLTEFGQVTFAADDFDARAWGLNATQALGVRVILPPQSAQAELTQHGDMYDVIFLSRVEVADKYLALARESTPRARIPARARIVFDTTDLAHVRAFRGAKLLGNMNLLRRALELKRTELNVVRAADVTLVVSPAEKAVLAQECPAAHVHIISNIHEIVPSERPFAQRSGILFVGAFPHHPNADGMQWFCDEIMPRVRERLSDVTITVVGSEPPGWLMAQQGEHFDVAGYVPNLEPLWQTVRISIAPLRYGAGVKGKVLQSMAHGVPVVGTTIAAEGIPAQHRGEMMVADDAVGFADALYELYQDENSWHTLARNGITLVQENFSRAVARNALEALFAELERTANDKS